LGTAFHATLFFVFFDAAFARVASVAVRFVLAPFAFMGALFFCGGADFGVVAGDRLAGAFFTLVLFFAAVLFTAVFFTGPDFFAAALFLDEALFLVTALFFLLADFVTVLLFLAAGRAVPCFAGVAFFLLAM
jgi:hypothetical protein